MAKGLTVEPKGIRCGGTVKGQMDYERILGRKAWHGKNGMHSILRLVLAFSRGCGIRVSITCLAAVFVAVLPFTSRSRSMYRETPHNSDALR